MIPRLVRCAVLPAREALRGASTATFTGVAHGQVTTRLIQSETPFARTLIIPTPVLYAITRPQMIKHNIQTFIIILHYPFYSTTK